MKKSKVLLIGVASVCMGMFVRKVIKDSVYEAEETKGNATEPVNRVKKPKSKGKAPVAKTEESKGNAVVPVIKGEELADRAGEQIKPVEKLARIAELPVVTKPCQNELMIVSQNTNSAKEFVERRKKRIRKKRKLPDEEI